MTGKKESPPKPETKITPQKIQMEPVLNGDEPKWLMIKYEPAPTPIDNTPVEELVKDDTPLPLVPTFEIREQGIWQCKKCYGIVKDIKGTPLFCTECNRSSNFTKITDSITEDVWPLPVWKDIEPDVFEIYDLIIRLIKDLVVFPEEMYYKIITLWIISTWKLGCWETVGFPVFRGLIGSGKTRALNIIQKLAYRCVPCATATFVAIGRLSHYHHVSLTLDEAHSLLNPRTEGGAQLLNFVKQSYKQGSKYLLGDKDNPEKVFAINNFGFKAFAGEKSFDAALVSRGIDIFMEKSTPTGQKIEYFKDDFEILRTLLLNYRYKTDKPPDLGENFILKDRVREIYESIISTGMHIGQNVDDVIEFAQECERESEEELQGTIQYEILRIIKNYRENATLDDSPEEIRLSEVCEGLGWDEKKDRQKLGYILRNMGLKSKHKTYGKVVVFTDRSNSRRLVYLFRRYKLSER